ncbi:MAG: DUF3990 domain-containing protein [Victivallales bacterium]|nr:DUF3990 domain-containing protein [Victivallales bacterium]
MMQIYHCNTIEVAAPKLNTAARNGDFGLGVYMSENMDYARKQAVTLALRKELPFGIISVFETPIGLMNYSALRIRKFQSIGNAWLNFILKNRRNPQAKIPYDIISGPALDDYGYACLNAFESGFMERSELIKVLKTCKLPGQILFRTAKSLLFLDFTGKENVPCPKK